MAGENLAIASDHKEESDGKTAVLCNDCTQSHTTDVPMEDDNEEKAAKDVDAVDEDGYPHGELGVLHSYKPTLYGIEPQSGWSRPYPDVEIGEGEREDRRAGVEDILGE